MNQLVKFLEDHHEVIGGLVVVAFMSFAATIPEQLPYRPQELWAWFRAFILEFMSLRSGKLVGGPPPKPAVEVPQSIPPQTFYTPSVFTPPASTVYAPFPLINPAPAQAAENQQ